VITSTPVTFFHPYPSELDVLDELNFADSEFWSHEGKERRRAWILQTYLRLREAGHPVSISSTLPVTGAVVLIPESSTLQAFRSQYSSAHRHLLIVTIRADVTEYRPLLGDVDVVQNGRFADDTRVFFVPHWPQPGLLPRPPARGTTIQNIVFKGGFGSLLSDFRSERWHNYLSANGLSFHIASAQTEGTIPSWHDYRTADLNLAVRPDFGDGGLRCEKPASKLINAWHAGVPSLLGAEYAFRELRTSSLDYVEVTSVEEAMAAINHLRDHPTLYTRMIDHGRRRAQEFTPERITKRWAELLFDRLPALASEPTFRWSRSLPGPLRTGLNFLLTPPSLYELRKLVGQGARHIQSSLRLSQTGGLRTEKI
jgi:hypothetical protein